MLRQTILNHTSASAFIKYKRNGFNILMIGNLIPIFCCKRLNTTIFISIVLVGESPSCLLGVGYILKCLETSFLTLFGPGGGARFDPQQIKLL